MRNGDRDARQRAVERFVQPGWQGRGERDRDLRQQALDPEPRLEAPLHVVTAAGVPHERHDQAVSTATTSSASGSSPSRAPIGLARESRRRPTAAASTAIGAARAHASPRRCAPAWSAAQGARPPAFGPPGSPNPRRDARSPASCRRQSRDPDGCWRCRRLGRWPRRATSRALHRPGERAGRRPASSTHREGPCRAEAARPRAKASRDDSAS